MPCCAVQRYKKDRKDNEAKHQTQIEDLEKTLAAERSSSAEEQETLRRELQEQRSQLTAERDELQRQVDIERSRMNLEKSELTGAYQINDHITDVIGVKTLEILYVWCETLFNESPQVLPILS